MVFSSLEVLYGTVSTKTASYGTTLADRTTCGSALLLGHVLEISPSVSSGVLATNLIRRRGWTVNSLKRHELVRPLRRFSDRIGWSGLAIYHSTSSELFKPSAGIFASQGACVRSVEAMSASAFMFLYMRAIIL